MSKTRMEWKVGVFVLLGLVLAAIMVMRFSKGTGLSRTYHIYMRASNASGIIPGAGVFMAGVPIGSVHEIDLEVDGSSVTMLASIYSDYKIASNAVFSIATVGFLGDRYIAVSPGARPSNRKIGFLNPGDYVDVLDAFDFSAVAETAGGLMARLSGTVDQLSNAVVKLDRTIISDQSLSNLTDTIANFRGLSERALSAVDRVDLLIKSNTPAIGGSVSNFASFTEKLNSVTADLQETVATNRTELSVAMKNLGRATERADRILENVEKGNGLAGTLINNEQVAENASLMMSNFMVFSSNINHKGLWGVLRKPKLPKKDD